MGGRAGMCCNRCSFRPWFDMISANSRTPSTSLLFFILDAGCVGQLV